MNARRIAATILAATAGALMVIWTADTPVPAAQSPVAITLPAQNTAFREAPGVEVARKDCLACHSAEYVTQQPALSKTAWTNEIVKMRTAYGAPIPEADTDALVAYLVAQNPAPKK
jgi:cytochrome c5